MPTVDKLLYLQSEVRKMRHELRTLGLTSGEAACFEAALALLERRARRLFVATQDRGH